MRHSRCRLHGETDPQASDDDINDDGGASGGEKIEFKMNLLQMYFSSHQTNFINWISYVFLYWSKFSILHYT